MPSILKPFEVSQIDTPLADRGLFPVTFTIDSEDGYQVLGFPLSHYNTSYDGDELVSPIKLCNRKSNDEILLFDSDKHGYHAVVDVSAKIRGEGDASVFTCSSCAKSDFRLTVQLNYHPELLEEFEHDEIPDLYHNIMIGGSCLSCGKSSVILDMDL